MAVRIRLLRMGKIRNPQYRVVVVDSRKKRDGRTIETIGNYHPKEEPSRIEIKSDRVQYWLSVGAQPTEPVITLLRRTGDWQKFKGLPAPSRPVKTAAPRADQQAAYEAAAKAAAGLAEQAEKAAKEKTSGKKGATKAAKAEPAKSKPKESAEPESEPAKAETATAKDTPAATPSEE